MEMKKISKQSQKFTLISLKTKNLKKRQIISICKLKNTFWKWTIQKQLRWQKKTAKKNDINNMLLLNNRLVGYTLLRKRNAYENNKIFSYYYLDAFVIHKEFRNKGLGKQLILFNNKILNKLKTHSFLICPKNTIPFYLKYNWKILPKNKFKIMDRKSAWFSSLASANGMTYNLDRKVKKKIFYYFN